MPAFEQHLTIMVRSIRAFLNLEAGVTRGGNEPLPMRADLVRQLEEARRELESRDRMLAELRARSVTTGTETRGINPVGRAVGCYPLRQLLLPWGRRAEAQLQAIHHGTLQGDLARGDQELRS